MIELYEHQFDLMLRTKKILSSGLRHVICQSPTGSGKTVMFSHVAASAAKKGNKILIITDRIELLSQTGGMVEQFNLNPYYIKAGAKIIDKEKSVYIAMSQTLRNRVKLDDWIDFIINEINVVIIDECHVQEFNYLFKDDLLKNKIVMGFTATPTRSGKMRQLGLDYERIIYGQPIGDLIKDEYLVNCDVYDCGKPNLEGVAINYAKGDYAETSMFKRYDTPTLYKGLIKNYKKLVPGQKMLVFCCNIEHAIKTTLSLNKKGLNAKFICSKKIEPKRVKIKGTAEYEIYKERKKSYKLYIKNFPKHSGTRDEIFKGFKNNDFTILVNVDIVTKGYDCPDIEVIGLLRATTSLALYLQMIGRGGRVSPGKSHFTVLDFGGNKERFGDYDKERNWYLWHEENKDGGIAPLKECGIQGESTRIKGAGGIKHGCRRLILASYKICPFCGFKYPKKNKAKEIDLILSNIKDKHGVSLKKKSFDDMDWDELYKYRKIKKHQQSWLWRQLWLRGKEKEIKAFAKDRNWSRSVTKTAVDYCCNIYY